jgi:truncated hemoglobin YjbI
MAIFDKYDLSTIAKAVDLLYSRALASDELSPYFKTINMNQLRSHQVELLSHVMGGPVTHRVDNLKNAHQKLNIPASHFDVISSILRGALADVGIDERDINQIMTVVETVRDSIVKNE